MAVVISVKYKKRGVHIEHSTFCHHLRRKEVEQCIVMYDGLGRHDKLGCAVRMNMVPPCLSHGIRRRHYAFPDGATTSAQSTRSRCFVHTHTHAHTTVFCIYTCYPASMPITITTPTNTAAAASSSWAESRPLLPIEKKPWRPFNRLDTIHPARPKLFGSTVGGVLSRR